MGLVADRAHVLFDKVPVAAQRLADIDHHVDFDRAIAARHGSFEAFDLGG
jgi:hypothetical protein